MVAAAQAYTTEYYTTTETTPTTTVETTTKSEVTLTAHEDQFTDCGGAIFSAGTFSSPNYPAFYPAHARCTWEIDIGRVPGFYLVPKEFAIETHHNTDRVNVCGHDHLKVVENGVERNFCGFNEGGDNDSNDYELWPEDDAPRADGEKEGGKWVADLPNSSRDGFPKMFVLGGKATVSLLTDYNHQYAGFSFDIVEGDRLDVISYHAQRVFNSLSDEGFAARYISRMNKMLDKARGSSTDASCYAENGFEEASDVTVFDEDDMCTLNNQVNSAINSWARNYACGGRGKTYRQIIRQSRKVRNFFNSRNDC